MRLSTVTACTIGLISAANWSGPARAAVSVEVDRTPQDVIVQTESAPTKSVSTIVQPESIAPEFSHKPSPTSQIAIIPASSQASKPNSAISPESSKLAQAQPAWIIPSRTPQTVQAPIAPARPATPPASTSDIVLTATDVQILGAASELEQLVRAQIKTQPGGNVSQAQLQSDIATILGTGLFSTASVSSRPNPNGLSVTFQVQPIAVRSLRLVNAQALTPAIANGFFQSQFGATVSPTAINNSIRQINAWYRQNGYNLARVIAVTPDRDGNLTLEVAEGTIGDIQFRFTDEQGKLTNDKGQPIRGRTRESFLRTQLQTKPGQVFQESASRQDLQRILQTGLFTNGRISLEGDARRTTVIYNLTEARSRALNVSGGINDDLGLFGSFNYTDRNFNGIGQQLGGNLLVGTRDVQFDGRFVSPYRATEPDKLGYSVSGFRRRGISRVFDANETKLPNGNRVREGRFGGTVAVNRPIGNGWDGVLGLNYTRISLRDADGNVVRRDRRGSPLSFSGTGIDDLTTLSFSATRDQRDNPNDPSRGSILTLSSEQSIPIGRGNILSNRLLANYSEYRTVNFFNLEKTQQQPEVLAFNIQAGTTLGDLPPYNSFTLGGVNTVRGYDLNDLAVGRSFLLASAEYRFPIYSIIGGAVFADFGSDLGSGRAVLGAPGVVRNLPGTGFGVGLGLRVKSPFGTFRAGYGINDQGEGRFQFGFGEKF